MCIYLKNIGAEFHPDQIWNDGALGFLLKCHFSRHLESMSSYPKSDTINSCLYTWRTIVQNLIPICYEMVGPEALLKSLPQQKEEEQNEQLEQQWVVIWDRFLILKTQIVNKQWMRCVCNEATDQCIQHSVAVNCGMILVHSFISGKACIMTRNTFARPMLAVITLFLLSFTLWSRKLSLCYCSNFVFCQPDFIFFADLYTVENLQDVYSFPPDKLL